MVMQSRAFTNINTHIVDLCRAQFGDAAIEERLHAHGTGHIVIRPEHMHAAHRPQNGSGTLALRICAGMQGNFVLMTFDGQAFCDTRFGILRGHLDDNGIGLVARDYTRAVLDGMPADFAVASMPGPEQILGLHNRALTLRAGTAESLSNAVAITIAGWRKSVDDLLIREP